MIGYLARRLVLAVSMVWAVSFTAFVAFGLAIDPTFQYAICLTPRCRVAKAQMIERFHLHGPILERYWIWFSGLFHHGFGDSTVNFLPPFELGTPIGPAVWTATWVTIQLLAVSLVLVAVGSLTLGVVSSRFAGSPLDWTIRLGTYLAWSMPPFLIGVILIRISLSTSWFHLGYAGSGFVDWLRWILLPAIALSLSLIGLYGRYIRTEMLDNSAQPYADVARGKGLSEQQVAFRHVLRNSLIPVVSVVSLDFSAIIGATLTIDYVFGLGGLAGLFLNSVGNGDPFFLTAIIVVIAVLVSCGIFLSDVALGWLDPRLRVSRSL